jgi:hypothetical protein
VTPEETRRAVEHRAWQLAGLFSRLRPSDNMLAAAVEALLDDLDTRPLLGGCDARRYALTAFGLLKDGAADAPFVLAGEARYGPHREYCSGTKKWCQYEPAGATPREMAGRILTDLAADTRALLAGPGRLTRPFCAHAAFHLSTRSLAVRVGVCVLPEPDPPAGEKC